MSGHGDEHERTMAFCEIALSQIKALRQPATPRNYEIWYSYATGYQPSLNQKINETLSQSGSLSDADLDGVYEAYLAPSRLTDRIDTVGTKVMDEIEQVRAVHPSLVRHVGPPCTVRTGLVRPRCTEGSHFCGVPVWRSFPNIERRI